MLIATLNSGSTSVKLAAFDVGAAEPRELHRERHATASVDATLLRAFIERLGSRPPAAMAHRIVHGGTLFTAPTRLEPEHIRQLAALDALAPLHNPRAMGWLGAARELTTTATAHVGVFDTAFFADLPPIASRYAVPDALGTDAGVRRYGFHGLAHESMWLAWCARRPDLDHGGRLITLQLGGGCSAAAILHGKPIDTSMGFTPLEGLVMATRSGDIDPAAIPYLSDRLRERAERIVERLNKQAGLLGLSGRSADIRELLRDASDEARFAVELYCYRARKYVGSYMAALEGCDGIVFGGGVGEHLPEVRARILEGMSWAHVELDQAANPRAVGAAARISAAHSAVEVHVLPVDEDVALARAAAAALERG